MFNATYIRQSCQHCCNVLRNIRAWLSHWRSSCSTEACIVVSSVFFTLFANQRFWSAWNASHDWSLVATWLQAAASSILITAAHCLILSIFIVRSTAKPILAGMFVLSALAAHYMNRYTVFFDISMMRSVLHTDLKEARELVSFGMFADVLVYGMLPALLITQVRLRKQPYGRTILRRLGFIMASLLIACGSLILGFQDLSALMRNQKEMRYLITPANFLISSARLAAAESDEARQPRIAIGTDAVSAGAAGGRKPRLLVVVVGETARAANWGLNGYQRQTTPELYREGVINFTRVVSCGTNTEVSVPCMFSPFGRKDYDEKKIRRHESVLHVLEHAGVKTIWRDNQSGCKGVCDGLEVQRPGDKQDPRFCKAGTCLDEILLDDFERELQRHQRDLVIVLHQIGNHGPAYSHRYPDAFRHFLPTCDDPDLGKCSREQIVNSYDNAMLYTDHFLARTIQRLKTQETHEAAMLYLSDHGESLGEKGIYLHGLPNAIAPREQLEVPMMIWMSQGFATTSNISTACLQSRASQPVSHDHLFHSMLGMMRVQTAVYDPKRDVVEGCRFIPERA
ncbi:phosphoethanolamine--lipid A transferase [Noviherbaspirillum sp. CPCC 100848]|uniref:Phosphoethanolamine--lipid A transferase n=1 Tax=Noviherbaspirillum album TaxID=3080276 RepID=A0ABU6J462_9BURK|nr:phosphoethanolamine--lipid A transferase [Noviherbaspirillum sp. CPCC 100848]MEC4718426.1 phosphoethanolamine--lipid A transferase [Noviherbaspirillum sp. CPCC 100848]